MTLYKMILGLVYLILVIASGEMLVTGGLSQKKLSSEYETRIKYQPPLHPILLVPGLGGSILYADTPNENGRRVWSTWSYTDYNAEFLVGFKYKVYTTYDDFGLFAIERLDPGTLAYYSSKYFADIIDFLKKIGYVPGVNLFGAPYDWRLSIHNISSEERLHSLITTYKPIIISHSMGGLVVEDYIRKFGDSNIRGWISIATPFKGFAGVMLQAFIDGYNIGNPYLSEDVAKRIALESYSFYELLPLQSLQPQPKIIVDSQEMEWKSYLTSVPSEFKIERVRERSPVTFTTKTYFIGNSAVGTPFDYVPKDKKFSEVDGDGMVPINSAWVETLNGTLDINTTGLDHLSILFSELTQRLIEVHSNNFCKTRGTYMEGGNILLITPTQTLINGIPTTNLTYYDDCIHIQHLDRVYSRNIGMQCDRYNKTSEVMDNGTLVVRECIYGYFFEDYRDICSQDEIYSGGCFPKPQNSPISQGDSGPIKNKLTLETWEIGLITSIMVLLLGFVTLFIIRRICINRENQENYKPLFPNEEDGSFPRGEDDFIGKADYKE